MFKQAENGRSLSKDEYESIVPSLRVDLLNAQFDLAEAAFPVLIIVSGDDRWGTNEVVDLLNEWMDTRYIRTRVFTSPYEPERPRFWPYWREMPANGQIGVFVGAWPLRAISDRLDDRINAKGIKRRIESINGLERTLVDGGTLVLKLWFHQPKDALHDLLRGARKDPKKLWYVDDVDKMIYDQYDEVIEVAESFCEATSTEACPWHVIQSTDDRARNVEVGRLIRDRINARLAVDTEPTEASRAAKQAETSVEIGGALASVDLGGALERDDYRRKLTKWQGRLNQLTRAASERGVATVLAFEGWDAAGKGGVIRRLTTAMAAPDYRVIPIAAPTEEERAHHYLWRFWRHVPPPGVVAIFDRTWYGRVLVERVEGFAAEAEWRRAYNEINDFERQLTDHGLVVRKFWLHIDPDEQLRRFEARKDTPYKKHKITDEDYRNREKWDDYVEAIDEMVARTDTKDAPWQIVAANDKRSARIEVIRTVCKALERRLKKDD
jgi:polyphosphate:AMP phosphotransferase